MSQVESEYIKTNFLINPKPIVTDKIGAEVTRQYIRLSMIFIFLILIIIFVFREYLDGLRFIQDLSITDTLMISPDEVNL